MQLEPPSSHRPHFMVCAFVLAACAAVAGCSGSGGTATHVTPGASATATATPTPTPTPTPIPVAAVFVADSGDASITSYARATGNVAPVGTIAGSSTGLGGPTGLALDGSGRIYTLNAGSGTVTEYAANPTGTVNETPIATIHPGAGASALGVDLSGRIYVSLPTEIEVFAANPSGSVSTPVATISKSTYPPLGEIGGIAFDTAGRVYVTDNLNGITVYPANPSGTVNEAPIEEIPRTTTTEMMAPWGIGVDKSGKIYVVDTGHVYVFPAVTSGTQDVAPFATIAGSNTELDSNGNHNEALCLDGAGDIYVANSFGNIVIEFPPNPVGTLNEAPSGTIAGSATGVNAPFGVAAR